MINKCINCGIEIEQHRKVCSLKCRNVYCNKNRDYSKSSGSLKLYWEKKLGPKVSIDVYCHKCGVKHQTLERKLLFPMKKRYYCSDLCLRAVRNSHKRTDLQKQIARKKAIERAVLSGISKSNSCRIYIKICCKCKGLFVARRIGTKMCGSICLSEMRSITSKTSGKISASKRVLRSKNEILFANLCGWFFNDIRTNEPIFNGWDADVIIEDIKVAVLWNGPWHYRKITEKHSVKQVQNRDRIKIKNIEGAGYIPYVIKDNGSLNKGLVEKEFSKFIEMYSLMLISCRKDNRSHESSNLFIST